MLHDDTARHRRTGIALICAATLCFATLDACAKWLVKSLPVVEVVWLRFALHVVLLSALLAPVHGRALLRMRSVKLQVLRGTMLGAMTGVNFWALQYLQLAETGAIQFSVPLLITLLSAWWLGERLDAHHWLAIAAGLAGVLLVVRPGSAAFHPAILLSIANALLYAAFNMLTRRMVATETPASMQLISAIIAALLIAPFALWQWRTPPDAATWGVVALCALCGGIGHHAVATAHRYATAAVLAPFLYQQIVYMTLWGWLLFAQVPDGWVVAGALVVIASGLYMLWVEMRR
jgi:drug/metabolite transporter (DMT)-like permease